MKPVERLAALAAGAVLLAGCSAPAVTDPSPVPAPEASNQPTQASQAPAAGTPVDISEFFDAVAAAQAGVKTYEMVMVVETTAEQGSMEGTILVDMSGEKPSQHRTGTINGQEFEMIMVDGDVFMKVAALGDQWFKMSPEQAAGQGASMPTDITGWAEESKEFVEQIVLLGEDTVNGQPATRYQLTVDAEAVGAFTEAEVDFGSAAVAYDLWLDAEQRMVRMVVDLPEATTPTRQEVTMGRFNEPVSIEAPEDYTEMSG